MLFFSPLPIVILMYSCDLTAADEAVSEYSLSQGEGNENTEVHAVDNQESLKRSNKYLCGATMRIMILVESD